MHVLDYLVEVFSGLFRFHRYSPLEKANAVLLYIAGLSLRDLSERYCFTYASREGVREWVKRLSTVFRPGRKPRRLVAVDETVVKRLGDGEHVWAAVDVDSGEIIALYTSRGRSLARAIAFLRRVLEACDGKPVIVVDRGPWYPWALKRLGIQYFHETYGNRNRIERWFRNLKERTKRFYNNINAKKTEAIEEIAKAIAPIHNAKKTIQATGGVLQS